ncbi:hypothetical protein ZPR_1539 [Zunongwangia profunda SM-A87]|uniref:Uncharacterized protein n=1 Tax=Zunongwangia profunda (strain DSM 18752 / CCTCC AB 206139 / SM-A87) TaxID=655815 RepID=D5BKX5_ZUNPS|nr:hypothetical protein ZPR_1539 [Zunongwangia profunda SM-A87]
MLPEHSIEKLGLKHGNPKTYIKEELNFQSIPSKN